MLQTLPDKYRYSVQQAIEGQKCTVVIRKSTISDDIIHKQGCLISKMKEDNFTLKRLLANRASQIAKIVEELERSQGENMELKGEIQMGKLKVMNRQQYEDANQVLQKENAQLLEQIQFLKCQLSQSTSLFKKQFQKWTSEMVILRQSNDMLLQIQQNQPIKSINKLEEQCKILKQQLQTQLNINKRIKMQKKLSSSDPIKIVEPLAEEDLEELDFVKGSFEIMGNFKRQPKDQFQISVVKSQKDSEQLFQDISISYEENEDFRCKSHSYRRSQVQIQTQRSGLYETTIIPRQKIEKTLNRRKNNHMKPIDEHTRIMNLSHELNEKDRTIKELVKKFQKEKKNSDSVKSRMKEQEKQIKHLKKHNSLKKEMMLDDVEKEKVKGEEIVKEQYQKEVLEKQNDLEENIKVIDEEKQSLLREITKEKYQNQRRIEENRLLNQKIAQILAELDEKERQKQLISKQKMDIEQENKKLKQKTNEIKSNQNIDEVDVYEDILMNIRVSQTHGQDSEEEKMKEEDDEVSRLKGIITVLKNKVSDYEDRETIPLEEVEDEIELSQVVTQTQPEQGEETDYWEKIAAKVEKQHQTQTKNNLFSGLLQGLLGQSQRTNIKTLQQKDPQVEKPSEEQEKTQRQLLVSEKLEDKSHQQETIEVNPDVKFEGELVKSQRQETGKEISEVKAQDKQEKPQISESNQEKAERKEYIKEDSIVKDKKQEQFDNSENIEIAVHVLHDSDSGIEPQTEQEKMKAEIQQLKQSIKDLKLNEPIPLEVEVELKEVVAQTDPRDSQVEQKELIQSLRQENDRLKQERENLLDRFSKKESVGEFLVEAILPLGSEEQNQLGETEERKEFFGIRVSQTHEFEEEEVQEEDDEVSRLRGIITVLKNKISDLEDRETIPLEELEVEEERELNEVVTQTQPEQEVDSDYWSKIAAKVEKQHQQQHQASVSNDLFSGLLSGLLGQSTDKPQETEEEPLVQKSSEVDEKREEKIEVEEKVQQNEKVKNELNQEEIVSVDPEVKYQDKLELQKRQQEHSEVTKRLQKQESIKEIAKVEEKVQEKVEERVEDKLEEAIQEANPVENLQGQIQEDKEDTDEVKAPEPLIEVGVKVSTQQQEKEDEVKIEIPQEEVNAEEEEPIEIGVPQPEVDLEAEVERLTCENLELRSSNRDLLMKTEKEFEVEYPEEDFNIRVSLAHDEESEVIDAEEVASLRKEVEQLREKVKSQEKAIKLQEQKVGEVEKEKQQKGEVAETEEPFLDFVEESRLMEDTLQTREKRVEQEIILSELMRKNEDLLGVIVSLQMENMRLLQKVEVHRSQDQKRDSVVTVKSLPEKLVKIPVEKIEKQKVIQDQRELAVKVQTGIILKEVSERVSELVIAEQEKPKPQDIQYTVSAQDTKTFQKIIKPEENILKEQELAEQSKQFKQVVIQTDQKQEQNPQNIQQQAIALTQVAINTDNNPSQGHQGSVQNMPNQLHYLDNQLQFQKLGSKFSDFRGRPSQSSYEQANNFILTSNDQTLLYTLQEELNDWKAKYDQLLKQKQIIQESLARQKSMWMTGDIQSKHLKVEPQVQLILDSGGSIQGKSQKIDDISNVSIKVQDLQLLQKQNAELKIQIASLSKINRNLEYNKLKWSPKKPKVQLNPVQEEKQAKQVEYSWNQEEVKKQPSETTNMKNMVDETISIKEVSGNTEYLNELIDNIIQEDKKQHSPSIQKQKEEEQLLNNSENIEIAVHVLHDSESGIEPQTEQEKMKAEIQQLKKSIKDLKLNEPIPLEVEVELKEVVAQTDPRDSQVEQKELIQSLRQENDRLKQERENLLDRFSKKESVGEFLVEAILPLGREEQNQLGETEERKELYGIRVSQTHQFEEEEVQEEDDEVSRLRGIITVLKNQISHLEDRETIPLEELEVEEERELNEVVTQTQPEQEGDSDYWSKIAAKVEKQNQQQNQAPVSNDLFSGLLSGLLGQSTDKPQETEEEPLAQKSSEVDEKREEKVEVEEKAQQNENAGNKSNQEEIVSVDSEVKYQDKLELQERQQEHSELPKGLQKQESIKEIAKVQEKEQEKVEERVEDKLEEAIQEANPVENLQDQIQEAKEDTDEVKAPEPLIEVGVKVSTQQQEKEDEVKIEIPQEEVNAEEEEPIEIGVPQPEVDLEAEVERLTSENQELRSSNRDLLMKTEKEFEVEYPEEDFNIRVSLAHDEESEVIDAEEVASLRKEVEQLREKVKSQEKEIKLQEQKVGEVEKEKQQKGEVAEIEEPFLDFVEESRLMEDTLQTNERPLQQERTLRELRDKNDGLLMVIVNLEEQNMRLLSKVESHKKEDQKRTSTGVPKDEVKITSKTSVKKIEDDKIDINKEEIVRIQTVKILKEVSQKVSEAVVSEIQKNIQKDEQLLIPNEEQIDTIKIQIKQPQQQPTSEAPLQISNQNSQNQPSLDDNLLSQGHSRQIQANSPQVKVDGDSIQTPRFDLPHNSHYFKGEQAKFLAVEQLQQKYQKAKEQIALKQQQIAALNMKAQWFESTLSKYKKSYNKIKKERQQSLQQIEDIQFQAQEVQLSEVQTQTSPYMLNQEGSLQKYLDQLQFKLDQEEKTNRTLKSKLKRWQGILRKLNGGLGDEGFDDLEIQEEHIQLCEVEIQVGDPITYSLESKVPSMEVKQKMRQTSKMFLSQIQNLKLKFVSQDSEQLQSQNQSDRGKNTKRSMGSQQQQKKRPYEKMLQLELNHIYRDLHSVFKSHRFKLIEELNVDNFKSIFEKFVEYIKGKGGKVYNSFEDIKEQQNDDSVLDRERNSGKLGGSEILVQDDYSRSQPAGPHEQAEGSHLKPLFIAHQEIVFGSSGLEINPLFIREVQYNPLSLVSHNQIMIKMLDLTSQQLIQLITTLSVQLDQLSQKVIILDEISVQNLEQVLTLCGVDNLHRLLSQPL